MIRVPAAIDVAKVRDRWPAVMTTGTRPGEWPPVIRSRRRPARWRTRRHPQNGDQLGGQAGVVGEVGGGIAALHLDRIAPGVAAQLGLELLFQRVQYRHGQSVGHLAFLGFGDALDFHRDVRDIRAGQFPDEQQGGLLVGPGVEVGFVKRGHGVLPVPRGVRQCRRGGTLGALFNQILTCNQ